MDTVISYDVVLYQLLLEMSSKKMVEFLTTFTAGNEDAKIVAKGILNDQFFWINKIEHLGFIVRNRSGNVNFWKDMYNFLEQSNDKDLLLKLVAGKYGYFVIQILTREGLPPEHVAAILQTGGMPRRGLYGEAFINKWINEATVPTSRAIEILLDSGAIPNKSTINWVFEHPNFGLIDLVLRAVPKMSDEIKAYLLAYALKQNNLKLVNNLLNLGIQPNVDVREWALKYGYTNFLKRLKDEYKL